MVFNATVNNISVISTYRTHLVSGDMYWSHRQF